MALGTFAAGPYTSTFNAVSNGLTDEGYRLAIDTMWENIENSDVYARSLLDGIWLGSNATIGYMCKEWTAPGIAALWPYGANLGTFFASAIPPGTLASSLSKALVLTAIANTPAAAATPFNSTLTAPAAILAPNVNSELIFGTTLRKIPIRLNLLPSLVSASLKHFS